MVEVINLDSLDGLAPIEEEKVNNHQPFISKYRETVNGIISHLNNIGSDDLVNVFSTYNLLKDINLLDVAIYALDYDMVEIISQNEGEFATISAIDYVIRADDTRMLSILHEKKKLNLVITGDIVLTEMATKYGSFETLHYLLENGFRFTTRSLISSAISGNMNILKVLHEKVGDMFGMYASQMIALGCENDKGEYVKYLLKLGYRPMLSTEKQYDTFLKAYCGYIPSKYNAEQLYNIYNTLDNSFAKVFKEIA